MHPDFVVSRALGMVEQGIEYELGKGGMNPNLPTPAPHGLCDCSGFIAWCFGISRKTEHPFYVRYMGGWFDTSMIYKDVGHTAGLFEQLATPRKGAIIVFGDRTTQTGRKQGHIGLITALNPDGSIRNVVHCSKGNSDLGDAIQVTDDAVFRNNKPRLGWWSGFARSRNAAPAIRDGAGAAHD